MISSCNPECAEDPDSVVLHLGDNREILRSMSDASVDSIVTDPPYGLGKAPEALSLFRGWLDSGHHEVKGKGFMGKDWDAFVPSPRIWKECLRVLKPGGHLLSFGGNRTYDLMVLSLRIAGFEIRDQIAWVRADGFPKARNARLATDDPSWEGWKTALKPAMEPIVLCRKPLSGNLGYTLRTYGTGALNIDGCRVEKSEDEKEDPSREGESSSDRRYADRGGTSFSMKPGPRGGDPKGRWPGNFVHDGSAEVLSLFPETKQGGSVRKKSLRNKGPCFGDYAPRNLFESYSDSGSAARFFYCPKASRKDREEGLEGFERKPLLWSKRNGISRTDSRRFFGRRPFPLSGSTR